MPDGSTTIDVGDRIETDPEEGFLSAFGKAYHLVTKNEIKGLTRIQVRARQFLTFTSAGIGATVTLIATLVTATTSTAERSAIITAAVLVTLGSVLFFCLNRDFNAEAEERLEDMKDSSNRL
jgi:hypothetical protein